MTLVSREDCTIPRGTGFEFFVPIPGHSDLVRRCDTHPASLDFATCPEGISADFVECAQVRSDQEPSCSIHVELDAVGMCQSDIGSMMVASRGDCTTPGGMGSRFFVRHRVNNILEVR